MPTISPRTLRGYLLQALRKKNWRTLVLHNSQDGASLKLTRLHVWQLAQCLAKPSAERLPN